MRVAVSDRSPLSICSLRVAVFHHVAECDLKRVACECVPVHVERLSECCLPRHGREYANRRHSWLIYLAFLFGLDLRAPGGESKDGCPKSAYFRVIADAAHDEIEQSFCYRSVSTV